MDTAVAIGEHVVRATRPAVGAIWLDARSRLGDPLALRVLFCGRLYMFELADAATPTVGSGRCRFPPPAVLPMLTLLRPPRPPPCRRGLR
jgi:hypothetical protein